MKKAFMLVLIGCSALSQSASGQAIPTQQERHLKEPFQIMPPQLRPPTEAYELVLGASGEARAYQETSMPVQSESGLDGKDVLADNTAGREKRPSRVRHKIVLTGVTDSEALLMEWLRREKQNNNQALMYHGQTRARVELRRQSDDGAVHVVQALEMTNPAVLTVVSNAGKEDVSIVCDSIVPIATTTVAYELIFDGTSLPAQAVLGLFGGESQPLLPVQEASAVRHMVVINGLRDPSGYLLQWYKRVEAAKNRKAPAVDATHLVKIAVVDSRTNTTQQHTLTNAMPLKIASKADKEDVELSFEKDLWVPPPGVARK